jgi:hypothetical protein
MKYICLVYLVENDDERDDQEGSDACKEESLAYDDASGDQGISSRPTRFNLSRLRPPSGSGTASCPPPTARLPKRRNSSADFILIDARDLNEALPWPQRSDGPASAASRYGRSQGTQTLEDAMKFMFMIYHDERDLDALPAGEMKALVDSALALPPTRSIESGHRIVSNALQRARHRADDPRPRRQGDHH